MGGGVEARRFPAPAKLNLFLHVLGRRTDGYHRLQTVFQLLDYGDEIEIALRDDGVISRVNEVAGVPPASDLAVRAAVALKEAAEVVKGVGLSKGANSCGTAAAKLGADIRVTKRLPLGGGLGGGSSDAATVLVALNRLWKLGFPTARLAEIGLTLGADVPVFVRGRSAFADGVGEALEPVSLPDRWFLVLDPKVAVSTAAIFQAPELTRDSAPSTLARFAAGDPTRNDLEPVVRGRYVEVARAIDWLAQHAETRMTGSGAGVFAAFETEQAAREIAARVPGEFGHFVAKSLNRSPLLDAIEGL